ncbi:MAG: hypothetical protein KDJ15_04305 [Alphaproteobacteria bacterium]|nr:hypothetical protein [Alphaproteobacteria bacterium]
MFGKTLDLGVKHDFMGAFLFYLTHLVLLVGLSTVTVFVLGHVGLIDGTVGTFFEGGHVHTVIGSLFVLWLGGTILHKKDLTGDMMSVLVVMVGLFLAWTTSVLLGLVPIALLTTMGKK